MKYILFLTLFMYTTGICFTQNPYNLPKVNGEELSLYFFNEMRKNYDKKLHALEITGVCWVKFKVLKNGNLSQVEVSPETSILLSETLKEIFNSTSGLWTFRSEHEWFIAPVKYTLQRSGKTESKEIGTELLNNFFIKEQESGSTHTFLPTFEYESPFSGCFDKKMKLKTN